MFHGFIDDAVAVSAAIDELRLIDTPRCCCRFIDAGRFDFSLPPP